MPLAGISPKPADVEPLPAGARALPAVRQTEAAVAFAAPVERTSPVRSMRARELIRCCRLNKPAEVEAGGGVDLA